MSTNNRCFSALTLEIVEWRERKREKKERPNAKSKSVHRARSGRAVSQGRRKSLGKQGQPVWGESGNVGKKPAGRGLPALVFAASYCALLAGFVLHPAISFICPQTQKFLPTPSCLLSSTCSSSSSSYYRHFSRSVSAHPKARKIRENPVGPVRKSAFLYFLVRVVFFL